MPELIVSKPHNYQQSYLGQSSMETNDDFLSLLNGPDTPENEPKPKSPLLNDDFKVVSLRSLLPKKYKEQ